MISTAPVFVSWFLFDGLHCFFLGRDFLKVLSDSQNPNNQGQENPVTIEMENETNYTTSEYTTGEQVNYNNF